MNVSRIVSAATGIQRLTSALEWLRSHGSGLHPDDKDGFSIIVRLNTASALPGAKEAEEKLSAIAKLHIKAILEHAITDCVNTIEIHKDTLRTEAKP